MKVSTVEKYEKLFWRIWRVVIIILGLGLIAISVVQILNWEFVIRDRTTIERYVITDNSFKQSCSLDYLEKGTIVSYKNEEYKIEYIDLEPYLYDLEFSLDKLKD